MSWQSLRHRLAHITSQEEAKEQDSLALAFDNYLETGFQLATFQGPLCAEPVEGMYGSLVWDGDVFSRKGSERVTCE